MQLDYCVTGYLKHGFVREAILHRFLTGKRNSLSSLLLRRSLHVGQEKKQGKSE
jgi:hypothetical protein